MLALVREEFGERIVDEADTAARIEFLVRDEQVGNFMGAISGKTGSMPGVLAAMAAAIRQIPKPWRAISHMTRAQSVPKRKFSRAGVIPSRPR